jgi:hypothetical protein
MFKTMCVAVVASFALLAGTTGVAQADPTVGRFARIDVAPAHGTVAWNMTFRGNETTRIRISGDGDTCLELRVYNQFGKLVISDTVGFGDDRGVLVFPFKTAEYKIEVRNIGRVPNRFAIVVD